MKKPGIIYAFIDSQNVNLSIRELGWELDFRKFRRYLTDKYRVSKAFLFLGFLPQYQKMYDFLTDIGFILVFKDVVEYNANRERIIKGNCDAELVLQSMIEIDHYDACLVSTNDGDFACLVKYLYEQNKLRVVLAPSREKCSALLKKAAREKIQFMNDLRRKLERI